jgi:hypothetical protein
LSEADAIRAVAPLFLRYTYDIYMTEPSGIVSLHQVAENLNEDDLGVTGPDYVDRLSKVAQYLGRKGLLERQSDEWGLFSITSRGLSEVEESLPSNERQRGDTARPRNQVIEVPFIGTTPDEFSDASPVGQPPVEIQESLGRFKIDHPDANKVAFIMMQFGQTRAHTEIMQAVRTGLRKHGIEGVRADDKRYHDHTFFNVLTYLHGCAMGMAIYERIETQTYNPNVALEVGYLFAMRKPVCLLKDETLAMLPADLVGHLYDPFDPQDPAGTIPALVSRWLSDKDLV